MSADRLADCFTRCRNEGRSALIGYLTAGDPDIKTSEILMLTLAAQVDILEIGMPFSDPMADGPVIQAASERALEAGASIEDVFAIAKKVHDTCPDTCIVLMGYANIPYAIGFDNFSKQASQAGVDGVLLVDIPAEESDICKESLEKYHLHRILLLSPTSSDERIKLASESASGFIYYVSLTGITGASMGEAMEIKKQVEKIRTYSDLPVCVGFGIKTPEQAAEVSAFSDGIVVGSHFVSQIPENFGYTAAMVSSLNKTASDMRSAIMQAAV